MYTLAIDTSARSTTVALLADDQLLGQLCSAEFGSKSPIATPAARPGVSAMLAPMMEFILGKYSVTPTDIGLFALPLGPGAFTGLRVGVVTAKAWAFANATPVLGVNTLEVVAAKAAFAQPDHSGSIRVCVNAQRQQVFAGVFKSNGTWSVAAVSDSNVIDLEAFVDAIRAGELVSGPGIAPILPAIESRQSEDNSIALPAEEVRSCDAESVARVALQHFQAGRRDDPWTLRPLYFRPSAAEEARLASK